MSLLDGDDLAYMRSTQAEARPTTATLRPQQAEGNGRSALGGRVLQNADDGDPVAIRIDSEADAPQALATEFGVHLVRITADMVTIKPGDVLKVSEAEQYRIVSDGDMDPWTTAQRLWAVRVVKAGA